jgi:hypothetical protein
MKKLNKNASLSQIKPKWLEERSKMKKKERKIIRPELCHFIKKGPTPKFIC